MMKKYLIKVCCLMGIVTNCRSFAMIRGCFANLSSFSNLTKRITLIKPAALISENIKEYGSNDKTSSQNQQRRYSRAIIDRSSTHLPRIPSKNDVLNVRTMSTRKKQSDNLLSQNKKRSPGAGHPCLSVGQSAFPKGTPSRNVNSKGVTTAIIMIRMSLRGNQPVRRTSSRSRPKCAQNQK